MKVKKTSNKLSLNKTTVAGLDHQNMRAAQGGATGEYCVPTGFTYCVTKCATHCVCPSEILSICYSC